ncbi:MAG: peptidoglycan editing factor PgeF [Lachnospiraceae bacterium]|nr:peptidoglycan editing factor PgeF [Lachnospiraceae bacterium]
MELLRKNNNKNEPMKVHKYKQIEYLTFPLLDEVEMVRHLFSTREGGVSKGIYASMNLSYARGDDKEAIDENFRRIAEIFETTPDRIVCSKQTHTTNVRLVTEKDCGKGVLYPADYDDVDGLITNVPGILLCTSYADCVPLYFVDVKNEAIGLGHSGWRGTVCRMGEAMLKNMREAFGTKPEDVIAAIGPSICKDCYEVGEEVAEAFRKSFPEEWNCLLSEGKEPGKYQLDLWEANKKVLLGAGILSEHLAVTDLCTCCNSEYLFSHRASKGKRGNLGAFMELRKS